MKRTHLLKAVAVLLLLQSILWFSGCAKNASDDAGEKPLTKIIVGSDNYAPYNYTSDDGSFAGVDVDLAREAFHRLGYEPVFRQIEWERKDEYLADGTVECLWGCFTMTGREDLYLWAGPYAESRHVCAVRADSEIWKLSDLTGKRVAVQATSRPEDILLNPTAGAPKPEWVYSFSSMNEVFSALHKGYADAICGHESAILSFFETTSGTYRILEESLNVSELGVAFSKDHDPALPERLTKVLQEMLQDGTTTEILGRYGLSGTDFSEVSG